MRAIVSLITFAIVASREDESASEHLGRHIVHSKLPDRRWPLSKRHTFQREKASSSFQIVAALLLVLRDHLNGWQLISHSQSHGVRKELFGRVPSPHPSGLAMSSVQVDRPERLQPAEFENATETLDVNKLDLRGVEVGSTVTLNVTDMAFDGKGIARVQTPKGLLVVFVLSAIPGQTVEAKVLKKKRSHMECRLLRVLKKSDLETDLPYQAIPGAPYAAVPLDQQHVWKEQTSLDVYRRLGKQSDIDQKYQGLIKSPSTWNYRNKMEYSFAPIRYDLALDKEVDEFALGFKRRGAWWAVENIDADSGLFDAEVEAKMHKVREWCKQTGLSAWSDQRNEGFFKHLGVRKSYADDGLLIDLHTAGSPDETLDVAGFTQLILDLWEQRVKGIQHTFVEYRKNAPNVENSRVIWGDSVVTEEVNGLRFRISMKSFFQTNPKSAERLYDEVAALALDGVQEGAYSIMLDLFCGTGTIAQILASRTSAEVVGVDIVQEAIEDAREAAKLNEVSNVHFFASDVGKFLLDHPEYEGKIRTLVVDPPRGGITPKTWRKVLRLGADRLVYVSCNPASQARDLDAMREFGYVLRSLKLFDQFPHTSHVEAIALIEKSDGAQVPNTQPRRRTNRKTGDSK